MNYNNWDLEKIYTDVMDNKLHSYYEELLPYKDVLKKFFSALPLFSRHIDYDHSLLIVRNIINLIKDKSVEEVSLLNSEIIDACFSRDSHEIMYNLGALLNPEGASMILEPYIKSFVELYIYGIGTDKLPSYKNFDAIMGYVHKLLEDRNNSEMNFSHDINVIVSACFYANQDKYNLCVLNEFYQNISQFIDHVLLNLGDIPILCFGMRSPYTPDKVYKISKIYEFVQDSFDDIKNRTCQKVI